MRHILQVLDATIGALKEQLQATTQENAALVERAEAAEARVAELEREQTAPGSEPA